MTSIFMNKNASEQDRIDREAADWVVKWEDREREPAPKEQSRWFAWLRRSPRNVQAYFDVADLHERLGKMDPDNRIDVDEWLTGRRAPVVSIAAASSVRPATTQLTAPNSQAWRWTAAASIVVLVAGVALWRSGSLEPRSYRTAVGQQSVNRLSDGSVMNLNTHSRAKVRFSPGERLIELEGEALFSVARDSTRPFLVRTSGATVRAVGTKFNVHEMLGETRVAVVEGMVQVIPQTGAPPAAREVIALSAGESARVSHGRAAKERTPDIEAAIAWQRQQLVFEDATLAEVAGEFNRYNTAQIQVEASLGTSKRLSGTFDALHPQSLLLYLGKDPGIEVEPAGEDFRVRAR